MIHSSIVIASPITIGRPESIDSSIEAGRGIRGGDRDADVGRGAELRQLLGAREPLCDPIPEPELVDQRVRLGPGPAAAGGEQEPGLGHLPRDPGERVQQDIEVRVRPVVPQREDDR